MVAVSCFLPGRAKDLPAPPRNYRYTHCTVFFSLLSLLGVVVAHLVCPGKGLESWGLMVWFMSWARSFLPPQIVQIDLGAHPSFCWMGTGGKASWVRQVGHLFPYSAKVKNQWIYVSTPLLCLHDVCWDKFIIDFYLSLSPSLVQIFLLAPVFRHP